MLTDPKTDDLRQALHQIWVNLYVEYVVKNPLSPVEHSSGVGVANELFEQGLEAFVVCFRRDTRSVRFFLHDRIANPSTYNTSNRAGSSTHDEYNTRQKQTTLLLRCSMSDINACRISYTPALVFSRGPPPPTSWSGS